MPKHSQTESQPTQLSILQRLNVGNLLSETTRNERRILLAASLVGIAIAQAGLLPAKISALGIEFERTNQRTFLLLLAGVLAYLTLTFLIYAAADLIAWRTSYNEALARHLREEPPSIPQQDDAKDKPWERAQKQLQRQHALWAILGRRTARIRAIWEFWVPVAVGAYAITVLLIVR